MNYYKIKYEDGRVVVDKASTSLEIIRKYDFCSRENDSARIIQLEGEQLAIAQSNEE